jgi:glucose/arabinose dehydrogenase
MGPRQSVDALVEFPGSHYADPKFSWFNTVGPTAIAFVNSPRLGPEYQSDALVGDINNGRLYRFKLSGARDGFVLGSPLNDMVADSDGELGEVFLGVKFGGITGIKLGPDGLLYVLSFGRGRIYAIFGPDTTGDFDGDVKSDVGVYRNGIWYTLKIRRTVQSRSSV